MAAVRRTELRVFGGVGLYDADGVVLALQPKRLALLVYLALAGGANGVSRDAVRALLWPELAASPGRNALNQAVHGLRQVLGADAVLSEGNQLSLSPDHLTCDAWHFRTAAERGNEEAALAFYQGPLLADYPVTGAAPFDAWVSEQRVHWARLAADPLWQRAESAASSGDVVSASRLAERALTLGPAFDEPSHRRWLRLLDRIGAIDRALAEHDRFMAALTARGLVPSPDTLALADELRTRPQDPAAGRSVWRRHWPATIALAVVVLLTIGAGASLLLPSRNAGDASLRRIARESSDILETTRSTLAREEYVRGESDFRAGRWAAAAQAFERAVLADSSFAMAHYRLSRAANWSAQNALALRAAEGAVRHVGALPPLLQDQLQAWLDVLQGRPEDAERRYRAVLARDSLNQDALSELADIRFHWGSYFGLPALDTRAQWERLLTLDPDNAEALRHLARVLAMQRDTAAFARVRSALLALEPGLDAETELHALDAFAFGAERARAAAAAEVAMLEEVSRRAVVRAAAVAAPELPAVARLLGPLLVAGHTFTSWEAGEVLVRAQLELVRGRLQPARALMDSAEVLGARARPFRAATLLVPGIGTRAEQAAAYAQLQRARADTLDRMSEPWRLYLLGSLAARLGDATAATGYAAQLERYDDYREGATGAVASAHLYARIVRAEQLSIAGRAQDALAALGDSVMPADRRLPHIWSFPRAHERFLRAELLARTGRDEDAVRWYRTFPDPSGYDLMYVPAAWLGQARALERLGRNEDAARMYARVRSLADRSLADLVPAAR